MDTGILGHDRTGAVRSSPLAACLAADPALAARSRQLRRLSAHLAGSNYDVSRVCNLRCEGCLFFEGDDFQSHADDRSDAEWDAFFAAEAARGVNFPYFAGAEPAL